MRRAALAVGQAAVHDACRNGHNIVVMKKSRPKSRLKRASGVAGGQPRVSVAEFKATCLELMDRVRETGVEYVVTKHGTPVARLVPYTGTGRASLFGSMKGTVLGYDRPLDPIDGEYDINRD
jgi:prevent-host-death family protein